MTTVSKKQTSTDSKSVLSPILIFFSIFAGLGALLIICYGVSVRSVMVSLLWLLACLVAGGGLGFLFSIPKVTQSNNKKVEDSVNDVVYHLHVNSNLTEISDWLTKIIVGLGLVNLVKIPPYFQSVAMTLSNGIDTDDKSSSLAFAYGLIACYTILGFLFGYLFTRLYLSTAISKADQQTIAVLKAEVALQSDRLDVSTSVLSHSTQSKESVSTQGSMDQKIKELIKKADEYRNINVSDYIERVKQKNISADNMSIWALKESISKDAIAQALREEFNEGLMIVLSTLINLDAQENDIGLLLEFGPNVQRLHVRYRVLLAIIALQNKKMINHNKTAVIELVNKYKSNADRPLLERIDYVLLILRN